MQTLLLKASHSNQFITGPVHQAGLVMASATISAHASLWGKTQGASKQASLAHTVTILGSREGHRVSGPERACVSLRGECRRGKVPFPPKIRPPLPTCLPPGPDAPSQAAAPPAPQRRAQPAWVHVRPALGPREARVPASARSATRMDASRHTAAQPGRLPWPAGAAESGKAVKTCSNMSTTDESETQQSWPPYCRLYKPHVTPADAFCTLYYRLHL